MANSLSDQLLKAGLITQEQIDKADQDKQKKKEQARAKFKSKPQKQTHSGQATSKPKKHQGNAQKKQRPSSDLAQFYRQRNELERQERETEEKLKREAAQRRKKTRKQIRELIKTHQCNADEADIRFNFVVGETVKYLYVTSEQQKALSAGELAITFLDGKRCLIPDPVSTQILELDPNKVVVRFTDNDGTEEIDWPDVSSSEQAAQQKDIPIAKQQSTTDSADKTVDETPVTSD